MNWTIDTGSECGAAGCDAAGLQGVLERAMAHEVKQAPLTVKRQVLLSQDPEALKRGDLEHTEAKAAEAQAAADAVLAKLPKVQEQMKAGIKAACDLAAHMGGKVTASVSGHYFTSDRPDGVFKRLSVDVDRAAPTED